MERVGNRIRSISKAKPLKEKGCKRTGCFRALLVGETVRGMAQVTGQSVKPASWQELLVSIRVNLEDMDTPEERRT